MTMNTRVHIAKPVSPEGLFLHVLRILEADPSFVPAWTRPADDRDPWRPSPGPLRLGKATFKHARKGEPIFKADGTPFVHAKTGEQFTEDENELRTTLGQGLAAIWEVTYAADGPLEWPGRWDDEDDEPDPDYGNTVEPLPIHLVSANFDTAYGYRTPNGANCEDLHAFLLDEIRAYLESVGCEDWVWHHEEKGTWHGPTEIALRGDAALAARHFNRPHPAEPPVSPSDDPEAVTDGR